MIRILIVLNLLFIFSHSNAQVPDTIEVAFDKSVLMVFYAKVDYWMAGSEEVMIRHDENKIELKAGVEKFYETNLIIQIGEKYYPYILRYNNNPTRFLIPIRESGTVKRNGEKSISVERKDVKTDEKVEMLQVKSTNKKDTKVNNTIIETCKKIYKEKRDFSSLGFVNYGVYFTVDNIFISEDKLFFTVTINNQSKIKYDIDLIRWVIESKDKLMKKSVFQPIDKQDDLLYIYNEDEREVLSKESVKKIYVFNKFTFDKDKKLTIELRESNGERIIDFSIEITDILEGKNI